MRIWIVEGAHPIVPGRPMTAHATKASALREAVELADMILDSADLPHVDVTGDPAADPICQEKIDSALADVDSGDVWITELKIDASPVVNAGNELDAAQVAYLMAVACNDMVAQASGLKRLAAASQAWRAATESAP